MLPSLLQLPQLTLSNTIMGNSAQSLKFSFHLLLRTLQQQSLWNAGCRKALFHISAEGKDWAILHWKLFSWLQLLAMVREAARGGSDSDALAGSTSLAAGVGFLAHGWLLSAILFTSAPCLPGLKSPRTLQQHTLSCTPGPCSHRSRADLALQKTLILS